jgi:hypothetical protein
MRSARGARTLAQGLERVRLLPGNNNAGVQLLPGFFARNFTTRPVGTVNNLPVAQGLYDPANEKDNCGVGMIANLKRTESHRIVKNALQVGAPDIAREMLLNLSECYLFVSLSVVAASGIRHRPPSLCNIRYDPYFPPVAVVAPVCLFGLFMASNA